MFPFSLKSNLQLSENHVKSRFQESSTLRFTLIFYYVLTNLQLAFKFVCPFIIREGAFCSNKVENLLVVRVVADVSSNQLAVPYYTPHVWPALKEKIPLVFNLVVHLFFLPYGGWEPVIAYSIPYEQLSLFWGGPIT